MSKKKRSCSSSSQFSPFKCRNGCVTSLRGHKSVRTSSTRISRSHITENYKTINLSKDRWFKIALRRSQTTFYRHIWPWDRLGLGERFFTVRTAGLRWRNLYPRSLCVWICDRLIYTGWTTVSLVVKAPQGTTAATFDYTKLSKIRSDSSIGWVQAISMGRRSGVVGGPRIFNFSENKIFFFIVLLLHLTRTLSRMYNFLLSICPNSTTNIMQ